MTRRIFKRHYVENYPSAWDDELVSGYIYSESEPEPRFEDNFYITEVNHKDGKYHLLIERDEWISDDLTYLEDLLMEWATHSFYSEGTCEIERPKP